MLRIYIHDLEELVEGDWTYYQGIIYFAMKNKNKIKLMNFIFVIRQFMSKKGNEYLLHADNNYWELLFEFIIYLIKDNSITDDDYVGCILLPIYLIENFHGRIPNEILEGIW